MIFNTIGPEGQGGGAGWTLLWTNPDTNVAFPASIISVNLTGYTTVRIDCKRLQGSDDVFSFFANIGETAYMYTLGNIDYANNPVACLMRRAAVTSSQISFSDNLRKNANAQTAGAVENAFLIPIRIYAQ